MLSRIARITTTMGVQMATQGHPSSAAHREPVQQDRNNVAQQQHGPYVDPLLAEWKPPVRHRNSNSNGSSYGGSAIACGGDPFFGLTEDVPMAFHEEIVGPDDTQSLPLTSSSAPFSLYTDSQPHADFSVSETSSYTPISTSYCPYSPVDECVLATSDPSLDWIDQLDHLETSFDFLPLSPESQVDSSAFYQQTVDHHQQQQQQQQEEVVVESPLVLASLSGVKEEEPFEVDDSPLFHSPSPTESSSCLLDLDSLENSIDWKAWSHYLSSDLPSPTFELSSTMKDLELGDSVATIAVQQENQYQDNSYTDAKASPQQGFTITGSQFKPVNGANVGAAAVVANVAQALQFSLAAANQMSGPLRLCDLPVNGLIDTPKERKSQRMSAANASKVWQSEALDSTTSSAYHSEDEVEEMDVSCDQTDGEEPKTRPKKRGVKCKPHIDEETDRRRALNREAALRYREKKRDERQKMQVISSELEERNKELKTTHAALEKEIAVFRAKLMQRGIL